MAIIHAMSELLPYERKGNVRPVNGRSEVVTAILISAWKQIQVVMPTDTRAANGLGARPAIL